MDELHEPHDHSRYHDWNDGRDFTAPLDLPGWDWRSVWGLDTRSQTFFAGLWRNGQRTPVPDYSLFGGWRYRWPGCVALKLVEITGESSLVVVRAMSIADPEPVVRSDRDLAEQAMRVAELTENRFYAGVLEALEWLQGQCEIAPGSQVAWSRPVPTPEEVDAEHELLVGRAYDYDHIGEQARQFGAESALCWALGRTDKLVPGGGDERDIQDAR